MHVYVYAYAMTPETPCGVTQGRWCRKVGNGLTPQTASTRHVDVEPTYNQYAAYTLKLPPPRRPRIYRAVCTYIRYRVLRRRESISTVATKFPSLRQRRGRGRSR